MRDTMNAQHFAHKFVNRDLFRPLCGISCHVPFRAATVHCSFDLWSARSSSVLAQVLNKIQFNPSLSLALLFFSNLPNLCLWYHLQCASHSRCMRSAPSDHMLDASHWTLLSSHQYISVSNSWSVALRDIAAMFFGSDCIFLHRSSVASGVFIAASLSLSLSLSLSYPDGTEGRRCSLGMA